MSSRGRGGHTSLPSHPRGGRGSGHGAGRGRGGSFGGGRDAGSGPTTFSHGHGGVAEPDPDVTRLENEIEKNVLKTSALGPKLPVRPAYGTQGRPVILWSNYMHLTSTANLQLHRYQIDFSQDQITGRKIRAARKKRVITQLLQEHFPSAGANIVTDFKRSLIATQKLALSSNEYKVRYCGEDEDSAAPNAAIYHLCLTPQNTLTVADLVAFLTSSNPPAVIPNKEEIIQTLNIVLGHNPKAAVHIASLGSNRHFNWNAANSEKYDLETGLLAIRGFILSVRAATSRLLINIQVKHAPFYKPGSVQGLMTLFLQENGPNKAKLSKFLKGLGVNVTHIVNRNRKGDQIKRRKIIFGLATAQDGRRSLHPPVVRSYGAGPKHVEFWKDDLGGYISVFKHFQDTYNITLTNDALPVLNCGNKENPHYLPVQVCQIEAQEPFRTELSPKQTGNMIKFAVRRPAANAQSLVKEGVALLGVNQQTNPTHNAFKIKINPRLVAVDGRVLASPPVIYGKKAVETKRGSWNMAKVQFSERALLKSWKWLVISTPTDTNPWASRQQFESTLASFATELRSVGIATKGPDDGKIITVQPTILATSSRPEIPVNVEAEVKQALTEFSNSSNRPDLVLIVLVSEKAEIYNWVKHTCDIQLGLNNVCVVARKFAGAKSQYFANVALKVNLKLGGRNQSLVSSKLGLLSEGRTMTVGLDVTHPSPGSAAHAPSIVGIVAACDKWLTQFPADIRIQEGRNEMVSALTELMKGRLDLWRKKNGNLPDNVLLCRDGVSEGQYQVCLDEELPRIQEAFKEVYPAEMTKKGLPRLTIVIVGKRHNTRFYPTTPQDADISFNPVNGTVVDRGVTQSRNWDFFLQAHTALHGTARPAHYYVIYDEIFRQAAKRLNTSQNTADALESLMHNMSYLFGRATKAVSICPPAYYADLV